MENSIIKRPQQCKEKKKSSRVCVFNRQINATPFGAYIIRSIDSTQQEIESVLELEYNAAYLT